MGFMLVKKGVYENIDIPWFPSIENFIELLKTYKVQRVVDVRTIPRSRHNPQFNIGGGSDGDLRPVPFCNFYISPRIFVLTLGEWIENPLKVTLSLPKGLI